MLSHEKELEEELKAEKGRRREWGADRKEGKEGKENGGNGMGGNSSHGLRRLKGSRRECDCVRVIKLVSGGLGAVARACMSGA